jgi:uncharacterized protein YecT (DUF1311 family)
MTRFQMACVASVMGIYPAMAQEINCAKAQTQVELTACAQRDWQLADVDLTEAYRAAQLAMKDVDATVIGGKRGASESLRAAERAWITYRDAVCLSESFAWQGGSGELMAIYLCRARIAKARTADLWTLANQN